MTTAPRTDMQGTDLHDGVVIPADRWQAALVEFVEASPLAGCTTVTRLEHGYTAVTSRRPVPILSTGERRVWALLEDLAGGGLRDVLNHADTRTLRALASLMARLADEAAS